MYTSVTEIASTLQDVKAATSLSIDEIFWNIWGIKQT